jgi:hypothetical protein
MLELTCELSAIIQSDRVAKGRTLCSPKQSLKEVHSTRLASGNEIACVGRAELADLMVLVEHSANEPHGSDLCDPTMAS